MSIWDKLFGGSNNRSSKQIAHDRLKVVLIHDRANVSPDVMEHIKNDIIEVISHYMDIDKNAMEIALENDADSVALVANIPVNNMRHDAGVRRR
ncbi:MAG: cell division topological specificity factor MinE [Schwartzia succinivorans]|nr:cell division topological specificity factor MinE [Schwartzia succinivorans]